MTIVRSARLTVQPAKAVVLAGCIAASVSLASLAGCSTRSPGSADDHGRSSLRQAASGLHPEVTAFYRDRNFRPLWTSGLAVKPEALTALSLIARAPEHGLDPARYGVKEIEALVSRAREGDRAALERADFLLSDAYARFAEDLRRPPTTPAVFYVDADLRPRGTSKRALLEALAAAPSLAKQLAANDRPNPLYDAIRHELALQLKRGTPQEQQRPLRESLNQARLLPSGSTSRYMVVDTAAAQLSMVEQGRVVDTMRVIVGKPGQATPMMAGLIRFAVLNPFWHIPPDLVPTRVAARVLREGPMVVRRERLEIVSDWGPAARRIDAAAVDWPAVAAGRERLRVRQLPGANNVMGSVKFMMPNRLGIYLHDTPDKALFARSDRRLSSGCVRVEDAARLARWLFGGSAPSASGVPEQRAYLPHPVPVYITALTPPPGVEGLGLVSASTSSARPRFPLRQPA